MRALLNYLLTVCGIFLILHAYPLIQLSIWYDWIFAIGMIAIGTNFIVYGDDGNICWHKYGTCLHFYHDSHKINAMLEYKCKKCGKVKYSENVPEIGDSSNY